MTISNSENLNIAMLNHGWICTVTELDPDDVTSLDSIIQMIQENDQEQPKQLIFPIMMVSIRSNHPCVAWCSMVVLTFLFLDWMFVVLQANGSQRID